MRTDDASSSSGMLGHNSLDLTVTVEVRLFNSLHKFAGDRRGVVHLTLPAGSSVGDIVRELSIPHDRIYLVLRNGRDVTPGLRTPVNVGAVLDDGDVIALSGPVPYSWGYGAPVV